jgi:hypothetical protein
MHFQTVFLFIFFLGQVYEVAGGTELGDGFEVEREVSEWGGICFARGESDSYGVSVLIYRPLADVDVCWSEEEYSFPSTSLG